VVGQNDSLRKVAKTYYDSLAAMNTIRNFNPALRAKLVRGQIVLVPLHDLVLSEQGRRLAEAQLGVQQLGGDMRKKQADIDSQLPQLREAERTGRYADVVAMANRLIGGGDLTGSQIVTVHRELGAALVALGRDDLAREAFVVVLSQQPDAELDSVRTSPKVLKAFEDARKTTTVPSTKAQDKKPRSKSTETAKLPARAR
jgi:hypothetical protein